MSKIFTTKKNKIEMDTSPLFFFLFSIFFFFLSTYTYTAISIPICPPSSCGSVSVIQFPFRLIGHQNHNCGYPGFDLSCKNETQTVLNLPASGDFMVTDIDYRTQSVFINDPDNCLPKRIISLNLSGSPFKGHSLRSFTFLNCVSSDVSSYPWVTRVGCLSGENYTVVAGDSYLVATSTPLPCRKIKTVSVPVQWNFDGSWSPMDINHDLRLTWSVPSCRDCVIEDGTCGYKSDTGNEIGCAPGPKGLSTKGGLPRTAKYGIIIGAGIPGLICIIGLVCCIGGKLRDYAHRGPINTELSTTPMANQPVVIVMGLDQPTIESYPKTVLGESGRLPKPNDDGTCAICLSEYRPKETLRSIPECNHYFHANCIDEWLKMNMTCPLCRTSPEGSSVVSPCSSMSSLLSSSQSSS